MSGYTKKFVMASARAAVDLASLMTLLPAMAISYTSYRVVLIVTVYFLRELSAENFGVAVDQVKTIVAEIREEGPNGILERLSRAVNAIGRAVVDTAKSIYQWVGLTAGFQNQSPSQILMLSA